MRKSGVVTPQGLKWHGELAALVIYALAKGLSLTWRSRLVDKAGDVKGPVIYVIWHNRLATCMEAQYTWGLARWPGPGLAALISASKDGALLARVLKYFKVTPVRGSSSRRGQQALLELTRLMEEGFNVGITPDGPKGPKYKVQEGVIALAQITGAAIIPVSGRAHWKWTFKSWDAFQLPLPFSICEIRAQEPVYVPREADDAERERLRAELERRMMEVTFD